MCLMRLVVVVDVVYERLRWGILSVYMFLESYVQIAFDLLWGIYCSFYSWCLEKLSELAIMNTLFMIFWMCNFFWFNLIEKKIEKSQWVLAQMVPHFHIRECIPWLCVNLPKKTQICISCVYWGEVYVLLNVLIENIISFWCTIFSRWPCRKLASWPFDSCFLLECGSYWLQVRIVNHVDVGWQIVRQSPHAPVLS